MKLKMNSKLSLAALTLMACTSLTSMLPANAFEGKVQGFSCKKSVMNIRQYGETHQIAGHAVIDVKYVDGACGAIFSELPFKQLTDYQGVLTHLANKCLVLRVLDPENLNADVMISMVFKPHASNELVTVNKKLSEFQREERDSYGFAEYTIKLDDLWKGQPGIPNLQSLRLTLNKKGTMTIGASEFMVIEPERGVKILTPNYLVLENAGCP